ncbi:MAG: hypothetical protein DRP87_17900 [Spirochaetes bacterium]|nr:MAG: hypothetical protein DRP87_17900 [Spirochaetota bacterium]
MASFRGPCKATCYAGRFFTPFDFCPKLGDFIPFLTYTRQDAFAQRVPEVTFLELGSIRMEKRTFFFSDQWHGQLPIWALRIITEHTANMKYSSLKNFQISNIEGKIRGVIRKKCSILTCIVLKSQNIL